MHYKSSFLAGVLPRLAFTGFNFAQPFLLQRVLDFVDEKESPNSSNIAYGLIGAYALVYFGQAVIISPNLCTDMIANYHLVLLRHL